MKLLIWLLLTCVLLPRGTFTNSVQRQIEQRQINISQVHSDTLQPHKTSKKQKGHHHRARSSLPGPGSLGIESASSHYSQLQPREETAIGTAQTAIGTAHNAPGSLGSNVGSNDLIQDFVQTDAPLLWSDTFNGKKLSLHEKKTVEGLADIPDDDMPNTVGPNPNIYGGYPENDNWGGFQLPSLEKLEVLKQTLHPASSSFGSLAQDYDYEHHALPEYDINESVPPFHIALLQGMKIMNEQNKIKKPKDGTKVGSHHSNDSPMVQLNPAQCETLYGYCKPKKPNMEDQYELPCPYKMLEKLYGCKTPGHGKKEPGPVEKAEELFSENEKPEHFVSEKPEEQEIRPTKPKKKPFEKPPKIPDKKLTDKPKEKPEKDREMSSLPPALLSPLGNTKGHPSNSHIGSDASKIGKILPGNKVGVATPTKGQKLPKVPSNTSSQIRLQQQLELLNLIQGQTTSEGNSDKISQKTGSNRNDENIPDFSDWSQWTPCSVTCSKGTTSRTRYCKKAKCVEKVIDVKQCIRAECPEYLSWTQWSDCDSKCGQGRTYRIRKCPGKKCPGTAIEEKVCFKDSCPEPTKPVSPTIGPLLHFMITGPPVPWTKWSPCTATCGLGMSTRKRNCKGLSSCRQYKDLVETRTCLKQECEVKSDAPPSVAPPSVSPPSVAPPSEAQTTCLRLQNLYRILHGSPQLEWSNELSKKATDMASYLQAQGIISSNFENFEKPGLSIAELDKNSRDGNLKEVCSEITRKWYSEQKDFDFSNPHLSPENKHFTQMIWKASTRLGLGMTKSADDDRIYFVAMYDPPGNADGYHNFNKEDLSSQVKSVVTNILNS